MKNLRAPFYIVSIVCTILVVLNTGLIMDVDELKRKNKKLLDEYVELKAQHDLIFDEVLRLEDENQILGSAAAINETK
tara:strand:+ start:191 stop:424 length:234 start_codon:yes stop_codon:yes gene_type:complete